jgi:MFS family permease
MAIEEIGHPDTQSAKWHVLLATWLGLMFDGLDGTIFVLILFPALSELLHTQSHAVVGSYGGVIIATFMVGWAIGAVFFGVLSDHIGRTKSMVLTILVYAICTGLCACSHNWIELAIFRFLVGCGIGGEQSTGIVLIAESWTGKGRLHCTGFMATAFGAGYMLAGLLNLFAGTLGWRSLFVAGIIPALLTVYIRAKLKEPRQFQLVLDQKQNSTDSGIFHTLKQLFSTANRHAVVVICVLASTAIVGYWAVMSWIPPWINQLTGTLAVSERTAATLALNLGAILSAIVTGTMVIWLGRQAVFRIAFVGAMVSFISMFMTVKAYGLPLLAWAFAGGFFVQLPFNCIFIYAPELFSTKIRGTAVGFSIQSGRVIGALGALLGGQLIRIFAGSYAIAGSCIALFYLVGIVATFFMPATIGEVVSEQKFSPNEKTEGAHDLVLATSRD